MRRIEQKKNELFEKKQTTEINIQKILPPIAYSEH